MGSRARPQLVDEVDGAGDGGGEADAVVGAVDVVVHRLRDGDDGEALVRQAERERQRVVAADRHERVDGEPLEHGEAVLGQVVRPVAGDLVGQERGHLGGLDPSRVRAGAVEDGAAGAVDGPHRGGVEHHGAGGHRGRVVRVAVQQPGPPTTQPDRRVALRRHAGDHRLDARVEARDVTSPGQHPYSHAQLLARTSAAPSCCLPDVARAQSELSARVRGPADAVEPRGWPSGPCGPSRAAAASRARPSGSGRGSSPC